MKNTIPKLKAILQKAAVEELQAVHDSCNKINGCTKTLTLPIELILTPPEQKPPQPPLQFFHYSQIVSLLPRKDTRQHTSKKQVEFKPLKCWPWLKWHG
jgi:hypothetical protein